MAHFSIHMTPVSCGEQHSQPLLEWTQLQEIAFDGLNKISVEVLQYSQLLRIGLGTNIVAASP